MAFLGIGLLTGWPLIKWILKGTWKMSLIAAAVLNAVSAGAILLFLSIARILDFTHARIFNILSDTLFSKTLSFFLTVFFLTLIETVALAAFCESPLYQNTGAKPPASTLRMWLGLGLANAAALLVTVL